MGLIHSYAVFQKTALYGYFVYLQGPEFAKKEKNSGKHSYCQKTAAVLTNAIRFRRCILEKMEDSRSAS